MFEFYICPDYQTILQNGQNAIAAAITAGDFQTLAYDIYHPDGVLVFNNTFAGFGGAGKIFPDLPAKL
jgi:hypothetical protein